MHRRQRFLGPTLVAVLLAACATGTPPGNGDDDDDVVDAGSSVDSSTADAAPHGDAPGNGSECASAIASYSYNWQSGAQGWVHDLMPAVDPPPVTWTFDHWEVGNATSGPSSCKNGSGCWATNLEDNYIQCQRAYLRSPPMDLSACADTAIEIVFEHWFDFWTGDWNAQTWYDGGLVELSADGTSWQPATLSYPGTIRINPDQGISYECVEKDAFYVDGKAGFVAASTGWEEVVVPIPEALRTGTFHVRFVYSTGVSWQTTDEATSMAHARPGWYIDDLRIQ